MGSNPGTSILDGHNIFSCIFVVRIVMLFEKTKINQKEAEDGPFFEKKISSPPGLIHRLDERTFVKIIISKETISALKCKKTKKNDFQLI